MKIGLVRHFKVDLPYPGKILISADELRDWFSVYETAGLLISEVNTGGIKWKYCFSSPLIRARETAVSVFGNEYITARELSELDILPLLNSKWKLPLFAWALIMKRKSESDSEITVKFRDNLNDFLDKIISDYNENTLLVCHGFVMMHLRKELRRRGYKGPYFNSPANAKVYIFEK